MATIKDEIRHFLIKHEECGAVFTIDTVTLLTSYEKVADREDRRFIECPSCRVPVIDHEKFVQFLETYRELIRLFSDRSCIIREIKGPIDPENHI